MDSTEWTVYNTERQYFECLFCEEASAPFGIGVFVRNTKALIKSAAHFQKKHERCGGQYLYDRIRKDDEEAECNA